jgi:hypothetical protein
MIQAQPVVAARQMGSRPAPRPLFGVPCQFGSYAIQHDITHGRQEAQLLHDERSEPALPPFAKIDPSCIAAMSLADRTSQAVLGFGLAIMWT